MDYLYRFWVCFLLGILPTIAFGQYELSDGVYKSAVLIELPNNMSSGSGFLHYYQDQIFIVSARHVILDTNGRMKDTVIYVSGYKYNKAGISMGSKESLVTFKVNILESVKRGNMRFGDASDVVVIKVATKIKENGNQVLYGVPDEVHGMESIDGMGIAYAVDVANIGNVVIGSDAFIVGYPKSLALMRGNYDFNQPLLRKGIVAGLYLEKNTIILDCFANHGNSGGPAVVVNSKKRTISIVGVVIAFIPSFEEVGYIAPTGDYNVINSGYSIVESIDNIHAVMDQN